MAFALKNLPILIFLKDYIIKSVDGILQRLKIDHLDSLLLHRPDALMESDQVAEAFDLLYKQGKVRDFEFLIKIL